VCIFELKLPDRSDGRSPRYLPVVTKTHNSADSVGAEYFVTWNVNSAVLWKTHIPGRAPYERSLIQYPSITAIRSSEALDLPDVEASLKQWVEDFLQAFARIVSGVVLLPPQPLDEGFIQAIQSYMERGNNYSRSRGQQCTELASDIERSIEKWPDFYYG
jgi:hypothetical protein